MDRFSELISTGIFSEGGLAVSVSVTRLFVQYLAMKVSPIEIIGAVKYS